MFHKRAAAILLAILWAGRIHAQEPAAPERISLAERAWIASKIYASIQAYFGHWQAVGDLDLDAAYRRYLEKALASDDRLAFDLASMEFMAQLRNGHSFFFDSWIAEREKPLGFSLAPVDGRWVVVRSRVKDLAVGDAVRLLDGRPFGEFASDRLRYIAASSDAARQRDLFLKFPHLFPRVFTLTLEDGRTLRIDRFSQKLEPRPKPVQEARLLEGGVAYLRIPSFERREDQLAAVEFIRQNAGARALIVDVRGNGGGITPSDLIRALMDRPYRSFSTSTSAFIGLFGAYGQVARTVPVEQIGERQRGYVEGLAEYQRPQLLTMAELNPPEQPLYTGPVFVLADGGCASACETFVMPLKVSGRGRVLGEATYGSTGQPFYFGFGNGMSFGVSTKRVYFPDGSPFEGVGIQPDVEVRPSLEDLRKGADPVLARALELARAEG